MGGWGAMNVETSNGHKALSGMVGSLYRNSQGGEGVKKKKRKRGGAQSEREEIQQQKPG